MPLMIASTYRPEYRPPWLDGLAVRRLLLQPLSTSETLQIVEARLGCNRLPEALARPIAKRAEGNALFAEEIASFLLDRAIVRFGHNGLEFDAATAASVLPAPNVFPATPSPNATFVYASRPLKQSGHFSIGSGQASDDLSNLYFGGFVNIGQPPPSTQTAEFLLFVDGTLVATKDVPYPVQ